jgi:spore coat protein I
MDNVIEEIERFYNFKVNNISHFRDHYILNTSMGKKVLKNHHLSEGRLLFINSAKNHIYRNGFTSIDLYDQNIQSDPFINIQGDNYTVSSYIEGKECNFDSTEDVILASRALALMHKASKGFKYPSNSIPKDDLGMLPSFFQKRLDEIKKVKKSALKGKSNFDYKVLEYSDYFYKLGEEARNNIISSKYFDLVKVTKDEGFICHHDFTHNNILINNNLASILNFEFCTCELKIYDISNLLKRKLRKCNWDIDAAKIILDEYRNIESISLDELYIIKAMLKFPQKFWRVINKYYNSKKSWSEKYYMVKLDEVIAEMESSRIFLENFEAIV